MNTSCMEFPALSKNVESFGHYESDIIEMPLLLSGVQMSALEQAAHRRGMTAAQMVRHLLREFIANQSIRSA
jgi:hypothetical protein